MMTPEEAREFYSDPEHLMPAGPAAYRRVRPGLGRLTYVPPWCGPQAETVNTGTLPRIVRLRP